MNGVELTASGIIGFFLPAAISLLKAVNWPRPAKIALTAAISLVLALIVNAIVSGFDWGLLANWGIIFGTASTIYATLLEKGRFENNLRVRGIKK